ncbi:MAG: hypothetical protein WC895_02185 [Candidatus Shapirobacteria bacterium]|jgi:hypothetical protein
MKIFNWLFGTTEKINSQSSPKDKITVAKALSFQKEYEKVRKDLVYLNHCVKQLVLNETEIISAIDEIKTRTNQDLEKEKLIKEIWILRYTSFLIWFFNLKQPNKQIDLETQVKLINHSFESILTEYNKAEYLEWFSDGFVEYFGSDQLQLVNLKEIKSHFTNKLAEKLPAIAFNCTGGRLGGELYDSIVELIMETVTRDQKIFNLDDNTSLTNEEINGIKNTVGESDKQSLKAGEDFLNSLINQ